MRSRTQRRNDALSRLETDRNAWIATVSVDGMPHRVPVSRGWHEQMIVLATRADRPLARNIAVSAQVRVGPGDGDDVVLIDGVASSWPWPEADRAQRRAFVDRTGWDPGEQPGGWVLLRVQLQQVRVWRIVAETVKGNVVMRAGEWLE